MTFVLANSLIDQHRVINEFLFHSPAEPLTKANCYQAQLSPYRPVQSCKVSWCHGYQLAVGVDHSIPGNGQVAGNTEWRTLVSMPQRFWFFSVYLAHMISWCNAIINTSFESGNNLYYRTGSEIGPVLKNKNILYSLALGFGLSVGRSVLSPMFISDYGWQGRLSV